MYFGAKPDIMTHTRELRKNLTESEQKLWKELRKLRTKGIIFRRQHPIDIFIADFYCHSIKLVIEVDGEIHKNQNAHEYDEVRSAELERYEIRVIRFKNNEILNDIEKVLRSITNSISVISSPSPSGEGD